MVADLWIFNSLGQQPRRQLKDPETENMITIVSDVNNGNN